MTLRFSSLLAFSTLVVLILSLRGFAQSTTAYTFNGDNNFDGLGRDACNAGDVNGDGIDDFAAGYFGPVTGGGITIGAVRVFSGSDGSILHDFIGSAYGASFGSAVSSAGDVNNDGFADIIVGAQLNSISGLNSGRAIVYSGLTGGVLYVFQGDSSLDFFGRSVSDAGDVNNDGFDDVIVGAYLDDNNGADSGMARVFSGIDGSVLYTFDGDAAGDEAGWTVSGAGDVNGDGFDDVMVGLPYSDGNGPDSGRARVYSGLNGSVIYTFDGVSTGDRLGWSVSDAGDMNNDGFPDVIVGAIYGENGAIATGSATAFSGLDGSIIHTFYGDSFNDIFGDEVSNAGDVNGDGFADVIVGARFDDPVDLDNGSASVFSGQDGSELFKIDGQSLGDQLGGVLDHAGDVNGDGFDDILLGVPGKDDNGPSSGQVLVILADTLPVLKYSTQSVLPHFLDLTWTPDSGDPYSVTGSIQCTGAIPGAVGVIGVSLVQVDFVAFGFIPFLIDTSPANLMSTLDFGFDGSGSLFAPGVSRQNPALVGSSVFIQCFQTSPLIFTSNGLRMAAAP